MVNQAQVNVVPSGVEDRELFVKEVNEIIKLREIVQSAKESEKMILNNLYEKHKELAKQKLINEYNAVKLGISTDTTKLDAYTNYLTERDNLKKQIDNDCKENGIN